MDGLTIEEGGMEFNSKLKHDDLPEVLAFVIEDLIDFINEFRNRFMAIHLLIQSKTGLSAVWSSIVHLMPNATFF
jgi:hypothetical protein